MLENRSDHVAVVLENKLYCIGGLSTNDSSSALKSTEYISLDEIYSVGSKWQGRFRKWKKGPDLHCTLYKAKALVSQSIFDPSLQQCIITGGIRNGKNSSKISLFDPRKGLIDIEGELDIERCEHVAVLL